MKVTIVLPDERMLMPLMASVEASLFDQEGAGTQGGLWSISLWDTPCRICIDWDAKKTTPHTILTKQRSKRKRRREQGEELWRSSEVVEIYQRVLNSFLQDTTAYAGEW